MFVSVFKECMYCFSASVKLETPKKVKDIECDLCKEVVQKVEDLVKDKKTEVSSIKTFLLSSPR